MTFSPGYRCKDCVRLPTDNDECYVSGKIISLNVLFNFKQVSLSRTYMSSKPRLHFCVVICFPYNVNVYVTASGRHFCFLWRNGSLRTVKASWHDFSGSLRTFCSPEQYACITFRNCKKDPNRMFCYGTILGAQAVSKPFWALRRPLQDSFTCSY